MPWLDLQEGILEEFAAFDPGRDFGELTITDERIVRPIDAQEQREALRGGALFCAVCHGLVNVPRVGVVPAMCSRTCRAAAWWKRKSAERAAAGVCQSCGEAAPLPGRSRCDACHEKGAAYHKTPRATLRRRERRAGRSMRESSRRG